MTCLALMVLLHKKSSARPSNITSDRPLDKSKDLSLGLIKDPEISSAFQLLWQAVEYNRL